MSCNETKGSAPKTDLAVLEMSRLEWIGMDACGCSQLVPRAAAVVVRNSTPSSKVSKDIWVYRIVYALNCADAKCDMISVEPCSAQNG